MHRRVNRTVLWTALLSAAVICTDFPQARGQAADWLPTVETHAWSRFGLRAWKEVRVRKYVMRKNGEVLQSSTLARTRVTRVGPHSYALCVSSILEIGGDGSPAVDQTIERDVAPAVGESEVVGEQQVTINGKAYATQMISYKSVAGNQQETNTIFFCKDTVPQVLKRVTTTVDRITQATESETITTVTVLNSMADILGEAKCTWSTTTVIKMRDKTITIREVNCPDVPGELVSQTTEEHDANGVLVARKELELVGYGGRPLRLFPRRDRAR